MTHQFKEGDIFHWRWTDAEYASRQKQCGSTVYWCRSQIAVFEDGRLRDTYWYSGSENGGLDLGRIILTFKGNANEMKTIPVWEKVFYRPEDVVDMNHPNTSNAPVYVKAGRDAETMTAFFAHEVERYESDLRSVEQNIAEYRAAIETVARGDLDGHFPIYRRR